LRAIGPDPAAVRAWIAELRNQIEDATSAGEDATRPLGQRRLGRMMARRMVVEAEGAPYRGLAVESA
jgi:hypothetical protein